MSIAARFVITGACYVGYSGKQFQLEIPVKRSDGARTTIADVVEQVRRQWPKEFSEMAESIELTDVKVLKTGRLLSNADVFESRLTASELKECRVCDDTVGPATESERSAVLLHLVFQRTSRQTRNASASNQNSHGGSQHENGNANNGGREVKNDNCCCTM